MERIDFNGQAVLVTGAGGGLGREYALEFARRGAQVIVNDLGVNSAGEAPSAQMADEVVSEIRAGGGTAIASFADIGTREGGSKTVHDSIEAFGRLDAVIINAGILSTAPFESMTDRQIDLVLATHLRQGYNVGQPAYQQMLKQKYGRFVFMGSAVGMFGDAWQSAYGPAKAALFALSNVIALEGKPHGIQSNVVLPTALSRMSEQIDPANLEAVPEIGAVVGGLDFASLGDTFQPVYNAALTVYLASRVCSETHGVFSSQAGRYARCTIGIGRGWRDPEGAAPSVEQIAEHWAEIADDKVIGRPQFVFDEMRILSEDLRARS